MAGETKLKKLFQSLSATLVEDVYVFVSFSDRKVPNEINPRMIFHEAEGTTVIMERAAATGFGLEYAFPCRMITLGVHSSLDAVGFIAAITAELAKHGLGVNPVSGFYHDHLFVPEGREQHAIQVLDGIVKKAGG